jgi:hypothetical protein
MCGARQARKANGCCLPTPTPCMCLALSPRALKEAQNKENGVEMLSYSPEQIAGTFWEMATLPVVFAELARQYSPSKVSEPASPIAAANGQYILIRRETYDAVGGHAAIAGDILEDVALARAVKTSGRKILFRYAADRRPHPHVPQLSPASRRLDEESRACCFRTPAGSLCKSVLLVGLPVGRHLTILPLFVPAVVHRAWWNTFACLCWYFCTRRATSCVGPTSTRR